MIKRLLKKAVLGLLLIFFLGFSYEILWSYFQIRHHQGSIIETIDPGPFVEKHAAIGIRNIHILSPENDRFHLKNIVLRNASIDAITETDSLLPDIRYMEGNERYLIPGLIDSHVHLLDSKNDLYLYLANGVTTVFEMYGTDTHIAWKKEAEAGAVSPDLYVASRKIGSRDGLVPMIEDLIGQHINLTSEAAVEKAVRRHKEAGYDALKLSSYLTLDMYHIILEEAEARQMPVIGHLSHQIGLKNLYGSGQAQLAHVEELVKSTMNDFEGRMYDRPEAYLAYLESVADDIAVRLKNNNIAVSTTIHLMESLPKQKFDIEEFIRTVPFQYANAGVVEGSELYKGWLPGNNEYEDPSIKENPQDLEKSVMFWDAYVQAIHMMTRALVTNGVTIMVGTDANVPCMVPGFSLHDEMKSLADLGMSNQAILEAAITTPAAFMNSKTGKIQKGYKANLVLLAGNPLESIENTRRIDHVFFNGYSMDRNQMNGILKEIEEANNKGREIDIKEYLD